MDEPRHFSHIDDGHDNITLQIVIYNIAIALFSFALWLASPLNHKARLLYRGRKGLLRRIEQALKTPAEGKTYWVHCASLGEFEQGRPLIEQIKALQPSARVVLTFFSPSGYELRKEYKGADFVFYLPADTASNARRFVAAVHADVAIFVKYEYWYHYLSALRAAGSKTYIVSAIFLPSMPFFKKYGGFFRRMLMLVDRFFVQNEASKELLTTINICGNVTVAGDTRFDRVAAIVSAAPELPIVEQFARDSFTMVCGSTWPPDQELLVELMAQHPDTKFIIAPHEINSAQIDALIQNSGRVALRYTQIKNPSEVDPKATLLVVDCIGILSGVYRYGSLAYIGGGFGVGIHNILEAATWGSPVIFGSKYDKFAEAVELIELGGAFAVSNFAELSVIFCRLRCDTLVASHICSSYVASHTGATQIILRTICN